MYYKHVTYRLSTGLFNGRKDGVHVKVTLRRHSWSNSDRFIRHTDVQLKHTTRYCTHTQDTVQCIAIMSVIIATLDMQSYT